MNFRFPVRKTVAMLESEEQKAQREDEEFLQAMQFLSSQMDAENDQNTENLGESSESEE